MGHLKFSEVIIVIQNYLDNLGTQVYFCPKVKNFAQVSASEIKFRLQSKGDEKNYFVITSIILPVYVFTV